MTKRDADALARATAALANLARETKGTPREAAVAKMLAALKQRAEGANG